MRHRLNKSFEILIPQLQVERDAPRPEQNLDAGLELELCDGYHDRLIDQLPQVRDSGPYIRMMGDEKHRQYSRLFGVAAPFHLHSEAFQIDVVDDAEIEGFFQGIADPVL